MPVAHDAAVGPCEEKQLMNAYTAEGHLRLVEVLLVPLSGDVVISLWEMLSAVSDLPACHAAAIWRLMTAFAMQCVVIDSRAGAAVVHEPPSQHGQTASQPALGEGRSQTQQQRRCPPAQRATVTHARGFQLRHH